ncbi:MAG: MurR/RpiR family transcriptional regulator, partial [Bacillota bacterium]
VPVKNINENIQTDDELKTIVEKITNANEQAINQTSKFIDLEMLQQAVDIISQAQKVEVYGVGASGIAAMDFKHKFMRIGINVDCFTDPHLQSMSASTLGEDDVVVGISHSGSTKDTVDSCKTARETGATVICITSHNRSPITKIADIKLLTAPKELPLSGGNLRSKIAQLHLLDLLSTGVALQNYEKTLEYNRKTAKSVLDKLY